MTDLEIKARANYARKQAVKWFETANSIAEKDMGLERFCGALGKANEFVMEAEDLESLL